MMWTLTEARVVIEDWRWKYNHVRPHRSLGYITPNEFTQDEVGEEAKSQCKAFGRATPSLRPSIDLLYNIEQIINLSDWESAESVDTEDGVGVLEFEPDPEVPARFFRVAVNELEE